MSVSDTNIRGSNVGDRSVDHSREPNEWEKSFFGSAIRVLNPVDARIEVVQQNSDPVRLYSLAVQSLDGIAKRMDDSSSVQVRITLIDMRYKQFFGRTWCGPAKKLKEPSDTFAYKESAYFCTPFTDDHILLTIEIVGKSKSTKKWRSYGWTAFSPFATGAAGSQRYAFSSLHMNRKKSSIYLFEVIFLLTKTYFV